MKSTIKEAMRDHNAAADFYNALDERVTELLAEALACADVNGRKTVQPRDL